MMRLREKVVTVKHQKSQVLKTASREATLVPELPPQFQLQLQLLLQSLLKAPSSRMHVLCQIVHAKATQLQISQSHSRLLNPHLP